MPLAASSDVPAAAFRCVRHRDSGFLLRESTVDTDIDVRVVVGFQDFEERLADCASQLRQYSLDFFRTNVFVLIEASFSVGKSS